MSEVVQSQKLILIVEDSSQLWAAMRRAIRVLDNSIQVVCVSDYESAVELIGKAKPDLIVCDYLLPNLRNGIELWDHVFQIRPRIPFLMISGIGTESYLDLVREEKFCPRFLPKPFRSQDLVAIIQTMLREQELKRVA